MSDALAPDLLDILADPETHEPVHLANEAQLEALRGAIRQGRARRRDGEAVDAASFEGALLSQGGKVAYLVQDGIANFLIDERVELDAPL